MTGYSSEDEAPHELQSDVVSRWTQSDLGPAREDKEGALKSDGIEQMPPESALGLLCVYIELLAKQTIDDPDDCRVDAFSLAKNRAQGDSLSSGEVTPVNGTEIHCCPAGYSDAGRDLVQLGILSKRFLSKRVPSITLKDYLLRLHRYRMVTVERTISLNHRNMHRLVLAGLRVAMKALEDLSYPHSRIAKVGGVTERELSKLEISFCFLADFELRVDVSMLMNQARALEKNVLHHGDIAS